MPLFTVDVFHTSLASITSAGWKHWRNTATSQVEGDIIRSEIFSGQQKGVKDFNSLNLPCCFISTEQLLSISRKFPNKTLGVQLVCLNQLILRPLYYFTDMSADISKLFFNLLEISLYFGCWLLCTPFFILLLSRQYKHCQTCFLYFN